MLPRKSDRVEGAHIAAAAIAAFWVARRARPRDMTRGPGELVWLSARHYHGVRPG
jgi:hypothetical protein